MVGGCGKRWYESWLWWEVLVEGSGGMWSWEVLVRAGFGRWWGEVEVAGGVQSRC